MMSAKKHHVKLNADERGALAAIKVQKAKILLAVDSGEHGSGATDKTALKASGLSIRSNLNKTCFYIDELHGKRTPLNAYTTVGGAMLAYDASGNQLSDGAGKTRIPPAIG